MKMLLNNQVILVKLTKRTLNITLLLFCCILILVLVQTLNSTFLDRIPQLVQHAQIINYSYNDNTKNQISEMTANNRNSENKNGFRTNLTALSWAHAVNNQKKLTDALDSNIDFIEADIVLGKINNSGPDIPIMSHPPETTSDLSLDSFLLQINDYNNNHPDEKKGVKLDFKSIEVFEGAMGTLKEKIPHMSYPIWLNADIVSGPVNDSITTPVNPEKFFAGCAQFKKAVLSIGWTTKWSTTFNNGSYTRKETNAMLEAIKTNNVTQTGQSITFPVRAGIAANSLDELHDLVEAVNYTNDCTLTIWSSPHDFVNIEKLRQLIYSFGFDRVYLDVPPEVSNQLDLYCLGSEKNETNAGDNGTVSATITSFLNFSLMSIGIILLSMWMQKVRVR